MQNTPDNNSYQSKLSVVKDLFHTIASDVSASVGSVVYELLIRPVAIIYAYIEDRLIQTYTDNTLKALSTSDNRDQSYADYILSNFFITRKTGQAATGIITVDVSNEYTRIPSGSVFKCGSIELVSTDTTHGVYPTADPYRGDDAGIYVDALPVGSAYRFDVPVSCSVLSQSILEEGTPVEAVSYIPGFISARIGSAVSGGSAGETDAEMVARAKIETCSWNGGERSIHKVLQSSGIPVYSSRSFDGTAKEMTRTDSSPVFIGTGGMIDTYVKTAEYPMSGSFRLSTEEVADIIDITDKIPKGFYGVTSVIDNNGKPCTYTVSWGSSDISTTAKGARLSSRQTAALSINKTQDSEYFIVSYSYMPNIEALQTYMDRQDVRILGTDILVKAAIPATLKIRATTAGSYDELESVKTAVRDYINSKDVGDTILDVSDINNYVNKATGAYIVHPAIIQTNVYDIDDDTTVSDYSDNGLLTLKDVGGVSPRSQFMCISDQGVLIE